MQERDDGHQGAYYWFSYPTAPRSMRRTDQRSHLDFHRVRDGVMVLSLAPVLHDAGYRFGGEILNFPSRLSPEAAHRQSVPKLGPSDLLVLPTRPPLDDDPDDRRSMKPSNTELESGVFRAMRTVFFS